MPLPDETDRIALLFGNSHTEELNCCLVSKYLALNTVHDALYADTVEAHLCERVNVNLIATLKNGYYCG